MNRQKGQSLFEVVFAIGMSALIIITIVVLAGNSVSNSTFSKNKTLAGRFVQEATELLRGERDTNWDNFYSDAATPKWCLPSSNWSSALPRACNATDTITSNSNFKREVEFNRVDSGNVEAKIRVFWQDGRGLHEVSSVTNFTDWRRQ